MPPNTHLRAVTPGQRIQHGPYFGQAIIDDRMHVLPHTAGTGNDLGSICAPETKSF